MGDRFCWFYHSTSTQDTCPIYHSQYIIVATDYLTKWVEAKATTKADARKTAQFLYEYVFVRYGLPIEIVSDRGMHFINEIIEHILDEFL